MVPRKELPYPLTDESFGDPVKLVTIPLPAIGSSPNEGITVGGLTAFLLHNNKDEVSTLLAPQMNYNKNYGLPPRCMAPSIRPLPAIGKQTSPSQQKSISITRSRGGTRHSWMKNWN